MRELPIDFEELAMAMEDHTGELHYFLDTQSGEVVVIPPELGDLDSDEGPDPALLADWEREELLPIADAIRQGDTRYELVPTIDSREVYRLMVDFTESVTDPHLAGRLEVALDGRGAFGRFKRVLGDDPPEEKRWFAMKQTWFEAQIREWLHDLDITPVARRFSP